MQVRLGRALGGSCARAGRWGGAARGRWSGRVCRHMHSASMPSTPLAPPVAAAGRSMSALAASSAARPPRAAPSRLHRRRDGPTLNVHGAIALPWGRQTGGGRRCAAPARLSPRRRHHTLLRPDAAWVSPLTHLLPWAGRHSTISRYLIAFRPLIQSGVILMTSIDIWLQQILSTVWTIWFKGRFFDKTVFFTNFTIWFNN